MTNRFKKVLSILCAIALLAPAATIADETPEESIPDAAITEEVINEEPAQEQPAAEDPAVDPSAVETEQQVPASGEPVADVPAEEPAQESEPVADSPAVEAEQDAPAMEAGQESEPATDAPTVETEQDEPAAEEPTADGETTEPANDAGDSEETPVMDASGTEPEVDPATEPATEPESETEPVNEPTTESETEQTEVQPENAGPAEEPVAEEEEASTPAQETAGNETSGNTNDSDLVEIDDSWGYVDPEVIGENVPEITDELKGLRYANLSVSGTLIDTLDFDEELAVTLSTGDTQTVDLKLYVAAGSAMNIKVDGKAVGFTPAASDDPSMTMTVYELDNVSGRSLEIVLTTEDKVSFKLAAIEKQTEVNEETSNNNVNETETTPEVETEPEQTAENNEEENTVSQTADNNEETVAPQSEETAPSATQVSVKTYDAMKVGESMTDNLAAGQQAKIQVKCGKNPFVTLTLQDSPDALSATIEGSDVQFSRTSEGTYTAAFENVAFRKFNIVLTAKQALDFTLTAEANAEAEAADQEATSEPEEATVTAGNNELEEAANPDETVEAEQPVEGTEIGNTESEPQQTEEFAELTTALVQVETSDEVTDEEIENIVTEPEEESVTESESGTGFDHEEELGMKIEYSDENPVFGTIATLKASVEDIDITSDYVLQWQYSQDEENWVDIKDANTRDYPVEITIDNFMYYWRVVIRYNDGNGQTGPENSQG